MKLTQSLLALCFLMCGVAGADERCGCSANKPAKPAVKPSVAPVKEMPKPAPQKKAAAEPKADEAQVKA